VCSSDLNGLTSSTAWFLFDVSRAVRALIVQTEIRPEFIAADMLAQAEQRRAAATAAAAAAIARPAASPAAPAKGTARPTAKPAARASGTTKKP
jgi:hypothetical protein